MGQPTGKTHRTALVVVPPPEAWEPIQRIRRDHDRQLRRWMPHITLLYPFAAAESFPEAAMRARVACRRVQPFEVVLRVFRCFVHRPGGCTMWLAPEPEQALVALHDALLRELPAFDDTARHARGFTPHLSVGQAPGRAQAEQLLARLQQSWEPLRFPVGAVALIRRERDAPFVVDIEVPLGDGEGGRAGR